MGQREQRALHRAAALGELAKVGGASAALAVHAGFSSVRCRFPTKGSSSCMHACCMAWECSHLTDHRCAFLPCPPQVRRLLEREPSLAATIDAQLRTPLHNVARGTSMPTSRQAIAAMLLAVAPEMAGAVDHEVGARLGSCAL